MATFHVVGNTLLEPEEALTKSLSGELAELSKQNGIITELKSRNGGGGEAPRGLVAATAADTSFSPIGVGKPLSIEIATVYAGEYKKFLGGKKDVVVVSGIRSTQTFQSASRAINIKANNVDERSFLKFEAFEDGTPIVYYTPAIDSESMVVSFEIMFDNFDNELFSTISGLLSSAAGIPVFMPAAPYLLAGSQLLNIGSRLGDSIFSGSPNLKGTIPIQFKSPILPPTEPREYVLFNEKDKAEFDNLKVAVVDIGGIAQVRLVHKDSGNSYEGKAPYMIVLLDGQKRDDLNSFAPTLASAAILKKFYGSEDKTGEFAGVLKDAMLLYNDSNYRFKGEKIKKQLDKLDKTSEEYKNLKTLYDAYAANIQTDTLKLPEVS